MTVGPFANTDTLFPGAAGDLELFTDEEVIALSNVGVLKSATAGTSTPKLPSLASHMEPDSSTRRRDHRDSLSHRHPVTAVAGSCEDLASQNMNMGPHANNFIQKLTLSMVTPKAET